MRSDALFGLISQFLRDASDDLQTPEDVVRSAQHKMPRNITCSLWLQHCVSWCSLLAVVRLLQDRLGQMFKERGLDFGVKYMRVIRPVKDLVPQSVAFQGAYGTRGNVEAPHSFTYAARASLDAWTLRQSQT